MTFLIFIYEQQEIEIWCEWLRLNKGLLRSKCFCTYDDMPFRTDTCVLTGCQDKCDVVLSCIENLPSPFRQMTGTLIEVCAYAGSGNVLKVRAMQL